MVVEDKTFGLKCSTKSKAVRNYVKGVSNEVMSGGNRGDRIVNTEYEAKAETMKK